MRIDGVSSGQIINISNISELLSKLNVGDVIRAQVLEITSGELLLKLFDGTTFSASAMIPVDAKKGDYVNFSVKSKNDKQLFLETANNQNIKIPNSEETEIRKQLSALNIKPELKNIDILKEIKASDLPLTRETFNTVASLVRKFKDLNPAKAVFMMSGNIPAEEKNISNLTQLIAGKMKLGTQLEDLIASLKQVAEIPQEAEEQKTVIRLKLIDLKTPIQGTDQDLNDVQTNYSNSSRKTEVAANKASNSMTHQESTGKSGGFSEAFPIKAIDSLLKLLDGNTFQTEVSLPEIKSELEAFFSSYKEIAEDTAEKIITVLKSGIPAGEKKAVLHSLISEPVSEQNTEKGNTAKGDIVKSLEDFLSGLNPETLKKDVDVKHLYKDLYSRLEEIKASTGNTGISNRNEILGKIETLQDSIRFLNLINNNNTYVQIPLNVQNRFMTAELYVLKKNKRRKKIDTGNATMFISLNTQSLGQVDSLVSINKKSISLNMRAENQKVIDFMKGNSRELYEGFLEKGYKLVDLRFRLSDETANVMTVDKIVSDEAKRARKAIDYKV